MYFDHTPPFPFQLPPDLSKMTSSQLHALIFFIFIFFLKLRFQLMLPI